MSERPLGSGVALGWAVVSAALGLALVELVAAIRPSSRTDIVTQGAVRVLVLLLVTFGVLRVHTPERPPRAALALRPTHPGLVAIALGLGALLPLVTETLSALVERVQPLSERELALRALLLRTDTPVHTLVLVLVMACVLPLVEELFFRGALFGALARSSGLLGAMLVSAIAFVIGHLDYRSWPSLLLVGLVSGHVRAAAGSLIPSIALSIAHAAVLAVALSTGIASATRGLVVGWPVAAMGFACVAGLAFGIQYLAASSPEAERARAEDAE